MKILLFFVFHSAWSLSHSPWQLESLWSTILPDETIPSCSDPSFIIHLQNVIELLIRTKHSRYDRLIQDRFSRKPQNQRVKITPLLTKGRFLITFQSKASLLRRTVHGAEKRLLIYPIDVTIRKVWRLGSSSALAFSVENSYAAASTST